MTIRMMVWKFISHHALMESAFNLGIEYVLALQGLVQETPVEATHWGRWARQLPLPAEFGVVVAPPLVGGIVVGSLRALTQFDKPTPSKSQPSASNPLKVTVCSELCLSAYL